MKRLLIPCLAALWLAASASGGDAWKNKPSAQWSEQETLELLTDSPWAKSVSIWQVTGGKQHQTVEQKQRVYQDAPGERGAVVQSEVTSVETGVVEGTYTVQWSSARLLQQARQRLTQVSSQAIVDLHAPPVVLPSADYVVTVRVARLPPEPARPLFAGLGEPDLLARAQLKTSAKRTLAPVRVARHGTEGTTSASVSFYFPRTQNAQPTIPPGTVWVEFSFESPAGDKLKTRFKLKEMQVAGQPDY